MLFKHRSYWKAAEVEVTSQKKISEDGGKKKQAPEGERRFPSIQCVDKAEGARANLSISLSDLLLSFPGIVDSAEAQVLSRSDNLS